MADEPRHVQKRSKLSLVPAPPLGARVLRYGPQSVIDRIQDAVDAVIDGVFQLRAALSALDDGLPAGTGLVRTPLGIVCAPDEPRCVAITVRGSRCANSVFEHPGWSGGVLATLHEDAEGFPNQLCRLHRKRPPVRTVSVDWFIVAERSMWSELLYV